MQAQERRTGIVEILREQLPLLARQHRVESLDMKVDLVMKNALKPLIGKHILSEVVPV